MGQLKEGAPWIGNSMEVGATLVVGDVEKRVVRASITKGLWKKQNVRQKQINREGQSCEDLEGQDKKS